MANNTDLSDRADSSALVTGGAGFIGSHLCEALVTSGIRVAVVDDLTGGAMTNLNAVIETIEFRQADLLEFFAETDLAQYDCIYHLAANAYVPPSVERPAWDYRINLQGSFRLLERLRDMPTPPRLVFASTAGVYGNPASVPIKEDDATIPIAPYGVSKLAAERYVAVYAEIYGIPACSLRLFSVYGPRQRKQIVFDFFDKLRRDPGRLEVIGDGTQQRDFVYVADVVQALMLAGTVAPAKGEVYNVASGRACTTGELARQVCAMRSPEAEIFFTGSVRQGDAQRWSADISRLRGLGYEPQWSLDEGLSSVMAWFDSL